jgi:hypothetical protein
LDNEKRAMIRNIFSEYFSNIDNWVTSYNAGLVSGYDNVLIGTISSINVDLPDVSPVTTVLTISNDNISNSSNTTNVTIDVASINNDNSESISPLIIDNNNTVVQEVSNDVSDVVSELFGL